MISLDDLSQLPALANLSQETRQAISQRAFTRNIPVGRTFIIEGSPADSGYFLLSGQARVLRMSEEGRIQVLGRFSRGDPLNIISLVSEGRLNRASIEALTDLRVLVIPAEDFDFLVQNYIGFSNLLLHIFAQRLTEITNLAAGLSLYSVRARLAQFLIELAECEETTGGWTQDEIAAHIGTVRDVVGRLLRAFEAQGLIARDRSHIMLLDRKGLEAIAEQRQHG